MSEPTEMELRVARALFPGDEAEWEAAVVNTKRAYIRNARKAIRVMYEPTKEMIESAARYLQAAGYRGTDPEGVSKFMAYAMIDTASPSTERKD